LFSSYSKSRFPPSCSPVSYLHPLPFIFSPVLFLPFRDVIFFDRRATLALSVTQGVPSVHTAFGRSRETPRSFVLSVLGVKAFGGIRCFHPYTALSLKPPFFSQNPLDCFFSFLVGSSLFPTLVPMRLSPPIVRKDSGPVPLFRRFSPPYFRAPYNVFSPLCPPC